MIPCIFKLNKSENSVTANKPEDLRARSKGLP